MADSGNKQIKKITIDKEGNTTMSIIARGTNSLNSMAITPKGTALYIQDYNEIKKITLIAPYAVDKIPTFTINSPQGMAVAPDGTALYIADSFTDTHTYHIKKLALPGYAASAIAGSTQGNADNSTGTSAQFNNPSEIVVAPDGTALYVADTFNHRIRRISLTRPYAVITIAGSTQGNADNSTGTSAQFNTPHGIVVAPDGTALYVADTFNHRIRKIALTAPYAVSTIAGSSKAGSTNGIGTTAQFNSPIGIATVSDTLLYVADADNNSIRKLEYKE